MGVLSSISLLLLLLHAAAAAAVSSNDSSSSLMQMQWGNARATWYGQPNGAGPYDNGMLLASSILAVHQRLGYY
jgi:hypothetical protein